ncbi:MAG TPA: Asp23/Gls24 family envelope stress response protein [Solirubrobacteraceae bacterium]|nr:Asp23/Gls24 family envelope stress response protein [Solirubrobacteraceae bacterium]
MAETTPTPASSTRRSEETTGAAATERTPGTALETSRGSTSIADSVVAKVAGIAAREVGGVHALGGSGARAIGSVTQRVGIGDARSQGVSVEVTEKRASVELVVVIEYGESIPERTREIREQIIRRVEGICGLQVTEVNISVADLHFPGDDDQDERA